MSNTFMKATEFQVRWTRRNSNILKRMETERSVYNSQWREDIFLTCLHAVFIYYGNKIPLAPSAFLRDVGREVFPRLRFCAMSGESCYLRLPLIKNDILHHIKFFSEYGIL